MDNRLQNEINIPYENVSLLIYSFTHTANNFAKESFTGYRDKEQYLHLSKDNLKNFPDYLNIRILLSN